MKHEDKEFKKGEEHEYEMKKDCKHCGSEKHKSHEHKEHKGKKKMVIRDMLEKARKE